MNKPEAIATDAEDAGAPVFVSYATSDRKKALAVCEALERRGTRCWISCRDVEPGENYQEAIVRQIRTARAMVLVFSDAANNSDEIKKELSLASRYHLPVMALRIEDVEPSDAFAYELSTRQWIDAFAGWDKSLDMLARKLEQISGTPAGAAPVAPRRRTMPRLSRSTLAIAASIAVLLLAAGALWTYLRPSGAAARVMQVRMTAFQNLSTDLPANFPAAMRDEIISSFGKAQGGQVWVSTASAPPPGDGPAYAFGGTMRREGDKVRVVARVSDERSGTMLWSDEFSYPGKSLDKLPQWFAVDTSSVITCALSGAATYPKALPEKTLALFFSTCGGHSNGQTLDAARRTVAATPDFSAGWSTLAFNAGATSQQVPAGPRKQALLKEASEAANKALRLDPKNAEAYLTQTLVLPHGELAAREALFKKAIAARPLACGCAHHYYGWFLQEVGYTHEALDELTRALDMDPLNPTAQMSLGDTLAILGVGAEEAQQHYDAAADMVSVPDFPAHIKMISAAVTGDYAGALAALKAGTESGIPPTYKAAMIAANEAMISGNPAAKAQAAKMIAVLPDDFMGQTTLTMLGALGANQLALQQAEKMEAAGTTVRARMWLWYPSMAGALRDPSFPGVAQRLGLMRYWKTTHTKPDVCAAKDPPPFCRLI